MFKFKMSFSSLSNGWEFPRTTYPNGSHVDGLPLDGHIGRREDLLDGSGDLRSNAIARDQRNLLGSGGVGTAGGGGSVDLQRRNGAWMQMSVSFHGRLQNVSRGNKQQTNTHICIST